MLAVAAEPPSLLQTAHLCLDETAGEDRRGDGKGGDERSGDGMGGDGKE